MRVHRKRPEPAAPPPQPAPSPYGGKELAEEVRRLGEIIMQTRNGPLYVDIERDREGRMQRLTIERG